MVIASRLSSKNQSWFQECKTCRIKHVVIKHAIFLKSIALLSCPGIWSYLLACKFRSKGISAGDLTESRVEFITLI